LKKHLNEKIGRIITFQYSQLIIQISLLITFSQITFSYFLNLWYPLHFGAIFFSYVAHVHTPLTVYFSILPVVGNSGGAGQASANSLSPLRFGGKINIEKRSKYTKQ
jgi:hypothetical protein